MKYEEGITKYKHDWLQVVFTHRKPSIIVFFVPMFIFLQIAIKPSSLSKMKTIFTQEIFTEQVHRS